MRTDMCKALVQALKWRIRYDDCNPDVGFGSSTEYELNGILSAADIRITDAERGYIMSLYHMSVSPRR